MSSFDIREWINRLSADAANERDDAANGAFHLDLELSDDERMTLSCLLVELRLVEDDAAAQESQLHTLAEFHMSSPLPERLRRRLLALNYEDLDASQRESLDELLPPDHLSEAKSPDTSDEADGIG